MATAPRQSQAKPAPARPDRQRQETARATAPAQALEALQQRLGNRGMAAWLAAQGSPAVQSLEAAADAFADAMASAAGQALVPGWPWRPQQHRAQTRPPGALLGPMLAGPGTPLAPHQRRAFEQRLGTDLAAVRLHQGPAAQQLARALGARAFALGADIVFGAAAPPAGSLAGQRLLAHELAHVDQQARGQCPPGWPLQLDDDPAAVGAVAAVPDDPAFDAGIDARAEHKNIDWFNRLLLVEAQVQRDLDPYLQPRAYANRVHSAQRLLQQHGVGRVEGARLGADGILGPRTFLALLTVARAPAHAARAPIQGLGFDLDHIAAALRSELAARTYARPAEVRLQLNLQVPGAAAVRWYDRFHAMRTLEDQTDFDNTLFGGEAPAGLRREDRVQILHRLYGQGDNRLDGRLEVVVAERDFIHNRLDVAGAVSRDRRPGVANAYYFNFVATSPDRFGQMMRALDIDRAIDQALSRLDAAAQQALSEALTLLQTQVDGDIPGAGQTAGVLLALYLPVPDAAAVQAASSAVMAERAERERQERDRVDANNLAVAVQRADALVAILDDDESNHLLVDARLRTELERAAVERAYFESVLDELDRRGRFQRLFDRTEAIGGTVSLSFLVRAARAGHWQNHARVRAAQALLIRRSGAVREHRYEVDSGGDPTRGAVLLDGDERVAVGRVAGDVTTAYLRDEDREQLRPAAQQRMTAALETEARAYMEGLLNGNETERSQDDVGRELMARAWAAAGLDPDEDIEDVTWEESVRVLGVRLAPDRGDGVPHYEIEYERVQRITGGEAGTPSWDESPGVDGTRRWGSESEFEYDMFWYAYSQAADVMIGFAKVVTIGAVVAIAWEVGLIGYLVGIAGGPVVVGSSVAVSMAFYLLTHRRWTLEGLLVAGLEGYLGALGFKLLAPVGAAVGRLALPATLEQVAFRRVVAAWLLRHGTTGALVGGLMGPASLLMQDLLRISAHGGGLSSLASYGRAAGMGMLLGAVFEIGGSTLLAGLFRNADSTVLARLDDVVTTLNGRHPRLTPSEWLAHVGRGLSATRTMLETLMVESQVRGLVTVITERVQQIGRSYLAGARATIHREVIEMAGARISREALDGLERMVRLGSARLGDDALATILQQARRTPDRIDPWLRFFSGLDDEATAAIAGRSGQLRALLDADAAMALAVRRSAAEVDGLLGARFGHAVADLDAFALRLNRLEASAADSVLEALRTRGTGATPHTLLRAAEAGQALDDELLGGLQRLLQGGTDPARLDAVFEAFAADQIGPFARAAQTADDAMLTQMREMVAQSEAVEVAWAMRRPVAEAHALLGALEAGPRSAILDIPAQQAQALLAALTPARVNRALGQGVAGPMRGSHLVTLRAELSDASLARYLDWAGAASGRLRAVSRLADGYAMLPGRMPAHTPLTAGALILDTNVSLAINTLLGGVPFAELNAGKQGIVNALRRERGLGPYVDPPAGAAPSFDHIVGPGSDLRAPRTTAAEMLGDELQFGRANVLDDMGGIGSGTAHPDHADVMAELDAAVIGQAKGVPDRLVVADALLSAPPGGAVVPRLLSADMPVVMGLAEHFGHPVPFAPRRGTHVGVDAQFAADAVYSGGRFMINIRGHLMEVIYR